MKRSAFSTAPHRVHIHGGRMPLRGYYIAEQLLTGKARGRYSCGAEDPKAPALVSTATAGAVSGEQASHDYLIEYDGWVVAITESANFPDKDKNSVKNRAQEILKLWHDAGTSSTAHQPKTVAAAAVYYAATQLQIAFDNGEFAAECDLGLKTIRACIKAYAPVAQAA